MDALFACTKCHSRHPFEELSDGQQLCKSCRNSYPIVKCTYCRAEFQHEEKNGTSSICKKCAYNVRSYGKSKDIKSQRKILMKPKACDYCNVIAAFIGSKCQRCAYSEKKYGAPQTCEQCKQQCAFDRQDGSKKKVDDKLLCWLCTMAYKRVLAKTKAKSSTNTLSGNTNKPSPTTAEPRSGSTHSSPGGEKLLSQRLKTTSSCSSLSGLVSNSGSNKNKKSSSSSKTNSGGLDTPTQSRKSQENKDKESSSSSLKRERDRDYDKDKESSSSSSSSSKSRDSTETKTKEGGESGTPSKKQKLEKTSNGITQSKSSVSPLGDYSVSENVVALTQLMEEVDSLKKQIQLKDQQILDRDKKITALKAENFEAEKEMKSRTTSMQKQHATTLETLKEKNRDLQKQVTTLTKKSS